MTSERKIEKRKKNRALLCESVNKGVIERPRDGKNVYAHERMSEQVELEEESQGLPRMIEFMGEWKLENFVRSEKRLK